MAKPIEVTDANFEAEVLKAEVPVLVDFWAEWCQPCKFIAPIVEELAKEYDGKVKFAKLDVDVNSKLAADYGIRGIPTLLIFRGGKPVDQVVGAVPKGALKRRLEGVLSKA
ncbi:MAG: thioredoxin [Chloroflexi bacterium]|nr:thioredoxin [Chloroflexota bacterium]